MIEKLNQHYSFTTPASIHDEEAMTALELAGRQGAKINEVIEDQNNLRTETKKHLDSQDIKIGDIKSETISEQQIKDAVNQIDSMVFVGGNEMHRLNKGVDGKMNIFFPANSTIKCRVNGIANEFTLGGSFVSGLPSGSYYIGTDGMNLTIPAYTSLVLEKGEKWSLALRENSGLFADDIVLAQNSFGEFVGGKLIDQYIIHYHNILESRVYAYLGDGVKMTITENANNMGFAIKIVGNMSVVDNGNAITVPWLSSDDYLYIDGNTLNAQVPNKSRLVYNTEDKRVRICSDGDGYPLKNTDICLIDNRFQNLIGGCLIEQRNAQSVSDLCYQATAFLGYNQFMTMKVNGDNTGFTIEFPCRISVIKKQSVPVEWNSVGSDVGSNLTVNGNTATLNLPNHNAFVFNTFDGLLHLRASGKIQEGDVVLLQNAWCSLIAGCLLTEYYAKKIDTPSGGGGGVVVNKPNTQAVESLRKLANGECTVSFLYFTDPHLITKEGDWTENFTKVMGKVKGLADTLSLDAVVCGGDWLDAHKKDDALSALAYIKGYTDANFKNFIHVVGNHDRNYQGVNTSWDEHVGVDNMPGDIGTHGVSCILLKDKTYYPNHNNPYPDHEIEKRPTYYIAKMGELYAVVLDSGLDWTSLSSEEIAEQCYFLHDNICEEGPFEWSCIFIHDNEQIDQIFNERESLESEYGEFERCYYGNLTDFPVFSGHTHETHFDYANNRFTLRNLVGDDGKLHLALVTLNYGFGDESGWTREVHIKEITLDM